MDLREISSYIIGKLDCDAEIYCIRSKNLLIESRDQKTTLVNEGTELGIALRVIKDGRAGFSYSSGGDLDGLIKQSLDIQKISPEDENNIFPCPSKYSDIVLFDQDIPAAAIDSKIDFARHIESSAYRHDKSIKKTENAGYIESETEVHIKNTKGIDSSYISNFCGGFAQMISSSGSGDEEEGYFYSYKKKWRDLNANNIGEKAAAKAAALLNGRSIASGKYPVVLDNEAAAEILSVISGMLSADNVQKGKSLYSGKTGKLLASEKVTLIDDGTLDNMTGTAPFDDEGVPTKRNIILEKGVLLGFLHNSYTSKKEMKSSTGNAKRATYRQPPATGPNNMFIASGKRSRNDMISGINKGILILRLMALHTVNPVSGDFSLGAAGLMIEDGRITYPVRGITISGNLTELLMSVEETGNDLEFFQHAGNCGSPSLLVNSLDISGD